MPFRLLIALLSLVLAMHAAFAAEPVRRAAAPAHAPRPAPAMPARGVVNVNQAGLEQLATLKGVGEKKARAILAWRRDHGPFNSLEQFEEVPGIGPALIEQNRARIVFR